eukprot:6147205-Prorocentrum_lima.AAC.1
MTLNISGWGAQGQPWCMYVVQEAIQHHQEWLDMSSREKAILESKIALGQPCPTPPMAAKLESMLR